MAYIYTEVEVDINVEDFLDSCSRREQEKLIKKLKEGDLWEQTMSGKQNLIELEWSDILTKLSNSRLHLTIEEEEIIKKIANRF
jgi:hypothetical protein